MSLSEWQANGWLRPHTATRQEITNLLNIVERDLKDSQSGGLSEDWRFGIAYNAALKLCAILLHSSGFRPDRNLAHYRTLQALPLILGEKYKGDADYLDFCRKKRNETEYDFAGTVSEDEALELYKFGLHLKLEVIKWLKKDKPNLYQESQV
jgi:hypothetical protein